MNLTGLVIRLWRWLGFQPNAFCGRPSHTDAHYSVHRVCAHWGWGDRIRILISGNTEVELCIETEARQTLKSVRQQAAVLPPSRPRLFFTDKVVATYKWGLPPVS